MTAQQFRAVLEHPVGINASYRIGFNRKSRRRVVIKSKRALSWEDMALITLRDSGFTVQPEQPYWCSVRLDLYTSRLDIDAPVKATLDLIMKSLSEEKRVKNRRLYIGVEDKWFGQLIIHKHFTSPRAEQRLEIEIEVIPIKNKKDFNVLTNERREKCLSQMQMELSTSKPQVAKRLPQASTKCLQGSAQTTKQPGKPKRPTRRRTT